ncbi:MAG: DNA repair exonuclease [Deltaproteobacteria bacterium]|nr:DNA repair exonuclease [Deltaproteobacteria bacterium]
MALRLLHTADLHLGMKFAGRYPPEVRERLVQARFETLGGLVETANAAGADLFLIAGDLFHDQNVALRDIRAAAQALDRFLGRAVLVLPGNHDFLQEGKCPLWDRFQEYAGDRVVLLSEPRPYPLADYDLPVVIYPGPCTAKHSSENAIGWIRQRAKDLEGWHIGVAHGSLEGTSPDFQGNYYPMTRKELERTGLDLWLLGHTHLRVPDLDQGRDSRILIPATPEPDGFDCRHPGHAWLIELQADGSLFYRSLVTGRHCFSVQEAEVSSEDDLNLLRARFQRFNPECDLVKLFLRGYLPGELYDRRGTLLEELRRQVLYLEPDFTALYRRIGAEDIDREFTEGSFPHRLLTRLAQAAGDPRALQLAYELIQEVRA